MNRFIIFCFITIIASIAAPTVANAAAPRWEQVAANSAVAHPALAEAIDNERFDVYTRDNYIYIFSPRATTVKVFSILGQLICEANVQQGISRMRIPSRGIYILKTGSITRRVTI